MKSRVLVKPLIRRSFDDDPTIIRRSLILSWARMRRWTKIKDEALIVSWLFIYTVMERWSNLEPFIQPLEWPRQIYHTACDLNYICSDMNCDYRFVDTKILTFIGSVLEYTMQTPRCFSIFAHPFFDENYFFGHSKTFLHTVMFWYW